ncbi:MarR family winged helix-turn-helix transcriptional regulator [Lentilactobacillus sp. SPB1-3]|uniref:MarR family winged helix-turn-helix transcriptional regulator n=1 Tax=Lentilactobacillus terminaliae TaxID=3003483 RepID=A0ACD5DFP5_9LACO|nr:MarR family transcriptional regulator [Lentilactobacillus sp. SPB1-3]MCZ0976598.1 MarR family transcriptional regulator [Lentilactobacillus sp. SPB1-3]
MADKNFMDELGEMVTNRSFMGTVLLHLRQQQQDNARGKSRMLQAISENDGVTNSQLSEILDIRPSSVSLQVKGLEFDGFIERRESQEDKRVSLIYITSKGRQALEQQSAIVDESTEKLMNLLTEDEQVELTRILKKLNDQLSDLDEDDEMFNGPFGNQRGFGFPHGRFPGGNPFRK